MSQAVYDKEIAGQLWSLSWKLVPFWGRINWLLWTYKMLWGLSFFWFLTIIFFISENNFYVYTNIACVCVYLSCMNTFYIYICMYTHIYKIVYVHTNMHMLPHMCGKKERLKPRFNIYFKPLWQCKPKPTPRTAAKLHRNVSKSPQELRPLVWWVIWRWHVLCVCARVNTSCIQHKIFYLISDVQPELSWFHRGVYALQSLDQHHNI